MSILLSLLISSALQNAWSAALSALRDICKRVEGSAFSSIF